MDLLIAVATLSKLAITRLLAKILLVRSFPYSPTENCCKGVRLKIDVADFPAWIESWEFCRFQSDSTIFLTADAMAADPVKPGLSIPSRLTSPGTPWSFGGWMRKSAAGASSGAIFGRMPD
ncbi:MAG: hypothetical protein R3C97_12605 [Geminicoccaceae bacterium]